MRKSRPQKSLNFQTCSLLMQKIFTIVLLITCFSGIYAQRFAEHAEPEPDRNIGSALLLNLNFGGQLPAADLADRFGFNLMVGPGFDWITESNWIMGIETHLMFGEKVKEDPLRILRTPEGDIIGRNQQLAMVVLRQRGLYVGTHVGKLVTFGKKRSGLRLTVGGGMLRHWIRLQDDTQTVPQITGNYRKGYDRLTGGFTTSQFIGWQHLGRLKRSNWCIGLDLSQGFTKSLRDWDYSERKKLDTNRLDLRFGLRATWTLPFYQRKAEDIEY
jgi:hypothetical protein